MATLQDILSDRAKYGDDKSITLEDGTKLTVGELREQVIPKGDMTRATQRLAEEKQQLQGQMAQLAQELAYARQASVKPTQNGVDDDLTPYEQDTTFGPMARRMRKMEQALQEKEQALQRKLQEHEQAFWMNQHLAAIERLKSKDKELKPEELITFARQKQLVNLDDAYDLMTKQQQIERAKKDGEAEGIEKGKKLAKMPPMPHGQKSGVSANEPPPPKDLADSFDRLMNDADIDKLYVGDTQ